MEQNKEILYIYTRVSTEKQVDKNLSLPEQKEIGIKMAKTLNLDYKMFEEAGVSASFETLENRPELQEIVNAIKRGECKHLYCFDLSRLSRNEITQVYICNELKKKDGNLYTGTSKYDLSNTDDSFLLRIMNAVSLNDAEVRKRRFKLGENSANRKGRFLKPITPYGYCKDPDGYLIVDKEESEIYLEIVNLYLKGHGTNYIAHYLNDKNVKTKTSKVLKEGYTLYAGKDNRKLTVHKKDNKWNAGTILTILKSELYTGKRRFTIDKNTYDYVAVEPLISKEIWDKIQLLRQKNLITKNRESKYFYLLKDLCQCGNCFSSMHGRFKLEKGETVYKCNSKRYKNSTCLSRGMNIQVLETLVWDAYLQSNFYSNYLIELMKVELQDDSTLKSSLKSLESELKQLITQEKAIKEKRMLLLDKMVDPALKDFPFEDYTVKLNLESAENDVKKAQVIDSINITKQIIEKNIKSDGEIGKVQEALHNAADIISLMEVPFNNPKAQKEARNVIINSIRNIVVTYLPETLSHKIEIEFKDFNYVKMLLDDELDDNSNLNVGNKMYNIPKVKAVDGKIFGITKIKHPVHQIIKKQTVKKKGLIISESKEIDLHPPLTLQRNR